MQCMWRDETGRITLVMSLDDALSVSAPGQRDNIVALAKRDDIRIQLATIDDEWLQVTLFQTGMALSGDELNDREGNELLLLWIAASDIVESPDFYALPDVIVGAPASTVRPYITVRESLDANFNIPDELAENVDAEVFALDVESHVGARCLALLVSACALLAHMDEMEERGMTALAVCKQCDVWYFG
jgi:hypothetical protein